MQSAADAATLHAEHPAQFPQSVDLHPTLSATPPAPAARAAQDSGAPLVHATRNEDETPVASRHRHSVSFLREEFERVWEQPDGLVIPRSRWVKVSCIASC